MSAGGESGLYTYTSKQIKKLIDGNDEICGPPLKVDFTGGSQANIDNLLSGSSRMAIIQSDILFTNLDRINQKSDTRPRIFAIASLYPEYTQVLVNKNSNFEHIIQLAGKNLHLGQAGSGTEVNAKVVLKSAGLERSINGNGADFVSIPDEETSTNEALFALCHGDENLKVDAVFRVTSSILPKLTKWKDCLKLVPINTELHEAILKENKFYGLTQLKIGTENVSTLYTRAVLVVASDKEKIFSDHLIKELTGIIHNDLPVVFYSDLPKNKSAVLFTGRKIVARLPIDFHPAATSYYEEVKLLKSNNRNLYLTILVLWVTVFILKKSTASRTRHEQRLYASSASDFGNLVYEFTIGQLIWLFSTLKYFLSILWQSISNRSIIKSPITVTIIGLMVFLWVSMVTILFFEGDYAHSHDIPNQFDNMPLPSFLIWLLQILTLGESPDGLFPKSFVAKIVTIIIPIIGVVGAFLALAMSTIKNKSMNELRARGLEIPSLENHVVLCGWNDHGARVVEEICTDIPGVLPTHIAVLDESGGDKPLQKLGLEGDAVHYLRGMSSDSENLERVSATKARSLLVLAGKKKVKHRNFRSIFTVRMIARALENTDANHRPKILVDMVFKENLEMFCQAGADRVLNTRLIGTIFLAYSALNMGFSNVITSLMSLATRPVISRVNASDHKKVLTKVTGMNFSDAWSKLFASGINLLAIIPHKGKTSPTMGIYPDLSDPVIIGENDYVITGKDSLIIIENQALRNEKVSTVSFADSRTDVQNGLNLDTPLVVIDRLNEAGKELKSLLKKRCTDLYYICTGDCSEDGDDTRVIDWDGENASISGLVRDHVLTDLDKRGVTGKIKFLIPTVENTLNFTSSNEVHKDDDTIALVLQLNTLKNKRFHYTAEIQCKNNLRLFKSVGVQQPIPAHEFASLALTKMTLFDGEVTGLILRFMENFFTDELETQSFRKVSLQGTELTKQVSGLNYEEAALELFQTGIQLLAIIPNANDEKSSRLVALPHKNDKDFKYRIKPDDELFVIA